MFSHGVTVRRGGRYAHTMDLWTLDATSTADLIRRREITAVEVVQAHLGRVEQLNPVLNAVVRRTDEDALRHATDVDAGRVTGALAGATVTTKINTDHIPYPSDNGIRALAGNVPTSTHPCVTGLLDSGLVMVGRTNSPAFAMRFHTSNDLHGETLNPHARDVSCGGSSGGAGVAVATGMCQIAQGNDVAGSIRWPATLNGVLGLRPTMGRIPTGGINPTVGRGWGAANMATNGPLARTMRDLRAAYRAMSDGPWRDPFRIPAPHDFGNVKKPTKVALVTSDGDDIDPQVVEEVRHTGRLLADAGYDVEEVAPPMLDVYFSLWERLGALDLVFGLAPMLGGIGDAGLTAAVEDWMTTLPPATPEIFMSALLERDLVMRAWTAFLNDHPLMVTPMMTRPSLPRAYDVSGPGAMADLMRVGRWGVNLSAIALPALAYPTGTLDGVPLGVQIVAPMWREDVLLAAGDALEAARGVVEPVGCRWAER